MLSVKTSGVYAGKSKHAVKFKGSGSTSQRLFLWLSDVGMRTFWQCVFSLEGIKRWNEKGGQREARGERHGRTPALSMHRGTIRLRGYTVNGGEPRGLSANKVIQLLIKMMEPE